MFADANHLGYATLQGHRDKDLQPNPQPQSYHILQLNQKHISNHAKNVQFATLNEN